jgi:hypothetical protein
VKTCTACGRLLELDEFHRSTKAQDGHQSRCKACSNETLKAWNKANPQRHAAYARRQRQAKRAAASTEPTP